MTTKLLNGQLSAGLLAAIPWAPKHRVRAYALASLVRLNTAFRARFGHDLIVNEGYRDLATQRRYYADPPSGAGTAAKPGTSNHGWGLALDLKLTGTEYAWMLANAPTHQWVNPAWARDNNPRNGAKEPWHWEHAGAPAVTPDPTTTPAAQEASMSAEDVAALKAHIDARLGVTSTAPNMPRVLLGPVGYYRVPNRQKPGEYMSVIDALATIMDYAVRGYVEANAAKKAAGGADVDEAALARELAPLLATVAPSLTDDDLAALATAVNDEADRRARDRLG